MRLASVRVGEAGQVGAAWAIGLVDVDHEAVRVLEASLGTVDDVIRGRLPVEHLLAAAEGVEATPLADVRLGSPLREFNRDVLCCGWNYTDHFWESSGKREGQDPTDMPSRPTLFTKGPDTVVGPHDDVPWDPDLSEQWDYEAELAVVIGREGRSIPEAEALAYVAGWLVANDVSVRDLQRAHGGQWLKGKSIDGTLPLGPWLTTPDEVPDPQDLLVECLLNGETLQRASTSTMAFSVATIISELSEGMTLRAGDVILTGTPSGIGNAREPKVFLTEGDEVVTRVSSLGELRNRVRREHLTRPR